MQSDELIALACVTATGSAG